MQNLYNNNYNNVLREMLFPVFLQIISALEAIFFVEVNLDKYEDREIKRARARGRKLIDDLLNMATRLRSEKMGLTLEEIKMIPKIRMILYSLLS